MQIEELMRLNTWFIDTVVEGGIIDAYSDLNSVVLNNVRSNTKTPFENESVLVN